MCKFACYIAYLTGLCVMVAGFWMCCVFGGCFVGIVNCVVRFRVVFILVWLFAVADWWFVCLLTGDFGLWFMCLQVCLPVCFGFLLLSSATFLRLGVRDCVVV